MDDWPIIFSYTRAQAIDDGVLIDVTAQAAEVGFKVHTVVTDHLYNQYVVPLSGLEGEGQSVEGRLHDLLFRSLVAARKMGLATASNSTSCFSWHRGGGTKPTSWRSSALATTASRS